ncbi:NAD(P)H-dependent oxidoreductase [Fructilactobacillus florum]|uniref:NAD(P)H-dependent oxidoreductase n=1 Tax=Fructilactobacillus florum TaxID=640331 RepID=UPI00054E50CC|nr:NAD(P)H-dependent oxidoreductase [Fructilactobacillus florum]
MKTTIIVSHPHYHDSGTQAFLNRASQQLEDVTWHCLDEIYAHQSLDVAAEQALLRQTDRIIFQFPLYWYSAPASLKHWEDEVLTRAFTYQNEQGILRGKELGIVTTLGYPVAEFAVGRQQGYSLSEIFTPYQALAQQAGMKFLAPLPVSQFAYLDAPARARLLIRYQQYLTVQDPFRFADQENWLEERLRKLAAKGTSAQQDQLNLIIETMQHQQEKIEDLKWQVQLMRQAEEG